MRGCSGGKRTPALTRWRSPCPSVVELQQRLPGFSAAQRHFEEEWFRGAHGLTGGASALRSVLAYAG